MQLNIFEAFILLSLDKTKGNFLIDSLALNYGLSGAILLQLSKDELIKMESKKVILGNHHPTNDKIIEDCLNLIKSSRKKRSAKYWVNKIGSKAGGYKNQILSDLLENRIIRRQVKTFFWIIKINYYPVINNEIVEKTKKQLVDVVLNFKKPELEDILLLSLLNSCKLTRIIFPEKKNYKIAKERINELTKTIEIGESVAQSIKEIQAAIVIAATSVFVAASTSH